MKKLKRSSLAVFFLIFFSLDADAAPKITVTGSWTQAIGESNLTAGAGSTLTSTYTSSTSAVTLNISNTGGGAWSVKVRKTDTSWPAGVTLYVKRTANGTGTGTITGGTAFMQVTNSDNSFSSGTKNRTGITCQFQITGMSLNVDPASYLSTVVFTVQ